MSILAPVSSMMPRITLPPVPITSRILSGSIFIVTMRGAHLDISSRGASIASIILPMMCIRPLCACAKASSKISRDKPEILISI